jgi:hypothetical protein
VTQSNSVDSTANAGNRANTSQDATQSSGGGSGLQVQGAAQLAATLQGAFAGSLAVQKGASNDASPVRLFSPGGGGDVNQSNSATSEADSGNDASTYQRSDQEIGGKKQCGCTGLPIQAVGQQAWTRQLGLAGSAAFQDNPQNVADPVRFKSPDGYEQPKPCGCKGPDEPKAYPDGGSCGCQGSPDGGSYGQQGSADGGSYGNQSSPDWGSYGGSNLNSGSPYGGSDTQTAYPDTQKTYPKGGSTDQSNTAGSTANGGNEGRTDQSASQLV